MPCQIFPDSSMQRHHSSTRARLQVNIDGYQEWIQLVADFTVNSLKSWQWAKGSVFYLLGLWSRLVSSMPYLKGESPSLLESYVPKIMKSYITSRCANANPRLQCLSLPHLIIICNSSSEHCSEGHVKYGKQTLHKAALAIDPNKFQVPDIVHPLETFAASCCSMCVRIRASFDATWPMNLEAGQRDIPHMLLVLRACRNAEAAWLCCRLDSVQVVIQSGLDDPLDREEELQDQMENLPYLCRFQYEESCKYLCGLMDPVVDAFSQCKPATPSPRPGSHIWCSAGFDDTTLHCFPSEDMNSSSLHMALSSAAPCCAEG